LRNSSLGVILRRKFNLDNQITDMKILLSGSHGLVGSALSKSLESDGHEVRPLVRHATNYGDKEIEWNPGAYSIALSRIEGFDAVIHLAGENIASGRWSAEKKQKIRDSRVKGTQLISECLAALNQPPKMFLCASAIGYYGNRGDEILTEESAPGNDFLADVCVQWENATKEADGKGIRTANLRFGVILNKKGGALEKMLPAFRMGVGGKLGNGKQWMSWIALEDVLGAIKHVLANETLSGPINFVSPNPIRNAEFTKALGRALSRPTLFPIPAFGARLAFGEMADALLLSSQRVEPVKLKASGYQFKYSQLDLALQRILRES
jgi:uncharacterized protein